jgi:hypothetical protein
MYNTSRTPVNYGLRWTASKAMMFLSMTVMSASRSLAVTIMQVHPPSGKCETADDLAFDGCKIEHLGIPALKSICENVGLDVEVEVFPFLFIDSADSPSTRTFGQEDYAAAAYGCISAAEENEPEYNFDESFVDEVLQESPEILAQIVSGVMESNPWLIDEFLEENLKFGDQSKRKRRMERRTFLKAQNLSAHWSRCCSKTSPASSAALVGRMTTTRTMHLPMVLLKTIVCQTVCEIANLYYNPQFFCYILALELWCC